MELENYADNISPIFIAKKTSPTFFILDMWPFFKKKQQATSTYTLHKRHPLEFAEIIAGMGDFSDLENNDVAFKFWLPEPVERALNEIKDRSNVSMSEFLRQSLAIHCYGLYAYYVMTDANRSLFKDWNGVLFSKGPPPMEQNYLQKNPVAPTIPGIPESS